MFLSHVPIVNLLLLLQMFLSDQFQHYNALKTIFFVWWDQDTLPQFQQTVDQTMLLMVLSCPPIHSTTLNYDYMNMCNCLDSLRTLYCKISPFQVVVLSILVNIANCQFKLIKFNRFVVFRPVLISLTLHHTHILTPRLGHYNVHNMNIFLILCE